MDLFGQLCKHYASQERVVKKGRLKHINKQIIRVKFLIENSGSTYGRRPQKRFTVNKEVMVDVYAELNRRRIQNTKTRAERRHPDT